MIGGIRVSMLHSSVASKLDDAVAMLSKTLSHLSDDMPAEVVVKYEIEACTCSRCRQARKLRETFVPLS